eukprot:4310608-Prymnesium_polylepis.1
MPATSSMSAMNERSAWRGEAYHTDEARRGRDFCARRAALRGFVSRPRAGVPSRGPSHCRSLPAGAVVRAVV